LLFQWSLEDWTPAHCVPPQMPDALGGYVFRQVNGFAGMDKMWNH